MTDRAAQEQAQQHVRKSISGKYAQKAIMSGIDRLGRAYEHAKALGELPDRTDACLSLWAIMIEDMLRTSPDDIAETVQLIGKVMQR